MVQAGPVRCGHLWRNLPLQIKAGVCLFLPAPMVAAAGIVWGLVGHVNVIGLLAAWLAAEIVAALLVVRGILSSVVDLHAHAVRRRDGVPDAPVPSHSWELNALADEVDRLTATLERERRELAECRARAEQIFEDAPGAYLETDADACIVRANRAARHLLRLNAGELTGKSFAEVLHPDPAAEDRDRAVAQIAGRAPLAIIEREYGPSLLLGIHETLLHDASGAISGIRYALTDRTYKREILLNQLECETTLAAKEDERARAMAEAAEAREARARFLANVSNDLRVPLNGIVGFAELMVDGKAGALTEDHRDCLNDILTSARHLSGVVDHLLDLARMEGGRPALVMDKVDLESMIYKARYVLQVLAAQKQGVRIDVELDAGLRTVPGDAKRLERLITATLNCGVKLAPTSSQIVLRTALEGSTAFRIEVETGAAPNLEFIAGALSSASDPELRQVSQLVDELGGQSGMRRSRTHGLVLYAILPMVPGVSVITPAATHVEEPAVSRDLQQLRSVLERFNVRSTDGCTVMVVGRDLHMLHTLNTALSEFGYTTVWLAELRDTLEMVAREQPSAVVVDLGESGVEDHRFVLNALRSVGLSTPVIGYPCTEGAAPVLRPVEAGSARLQPLTPSRRRSA